VPPPPPHPTPHPDPMTPSWCSLVVDGLCPVCLRVRRPYLASHHCCSVSRCRLSFPPQFDSSSSGVPSCSSSCAVIPCPYIYTSPFFFVACNRLTFLHTPTYPATLFLFLYFRAALFPVRAFCVCLRCVVSGTLPGRAPCCLCSANSLCSRS
jgi:hypothetical protein